MKCFFALVLLVGLGLANAESEAAPKFGVDLDVIELADRLGFYSYLLALNETGLLDTVRNTSPITLFIPTNDAFLSLNQSTRDAWAADPMYYKKLMSYHVVKGSFPAANLTDEFNYPTLAGENVTARVNIYNHSQIIVTYMGSMVVQTNYVATNGIIHVIDKVVEDIQNKTMLERVSESADLSMFFNATKILPSFTAFLDGKTPYTLFAPSNMAINKLKPGVWDDLLKNATQLDEILTNHVASEGTYYSPGLTDGWTLPTLNKAAHLTVHVKDNMVYIDGNLVTEANNAAVNGVVHVVDGVLFPI